MKIWKSSLQGEFEPLRRYLRPVDGLARVYPGSHANETYRVVIHRDGSIVGVDDEDWDNRIQLTQSDIVVYEFDLDLFRRSLCDTLGFQMSGTPLPEMSPTVHVGTWEPEPSARFPVYLLQVNSYNLRDKVFARIVEKKSFGEILLVPPRDKWDDTIYELAKESKVLLVPLDEAIWLKDGKI
ncbi:MAG: hypothetical protein FWC43_04870, partial [Planctomycetaceae bacterium]|nr:hypothetical protein [Planctomycetaceae bacterium]